jgi:hypothetical protein
MQQWNVSLQRETVQGLVVTAAYVGSKGTKLAIQRELNPAIFGPGATTANINQRRVYAPKFGTIADYESNGFSTYHSMQLSLNKRFAHGYTILANYTWAKSIDNDSLDTAGAVQNTFDLRSEKALSDFDIRHRFVTSFLWEIPTVKKGHSDAQPRTAFQRGQRAGPRVVGRRVAAAQSGRQPVPGHWQVARSTDRPILQSGGLCATHAGHVRQQRPQYADGSWIGESGCVVIQDVHSARVDETAVSRGIL